MTAQNQTIDMNIKANPIKKLNKMHIKHNKHNLINNNL